MGKEWTERRRLQRKHGPDTKGRINHANLTAGLAIEGSSIAFLRTRVFLKSPVLENGTPGSVRGASGNWRPYRDAGQRAVIHLALAQGANSTVSFDYQPVLKGDLVELRPLRSEDYDDLYAIAADPLIWEQHPVKNRHEEGCFEVFFREALASGGALLAIDTRTQRIIGSSRFHGYDKERSAVEIGWTFLARSHWGGMYNGQMKELMLGHAFRFVNCVVFLVGPQNLRSQRAVEKIGGVRVGSRPDAEGRDSYVYQITASAFVRQ